jgi:hypothetical protein
MPTQKQIQANRANAQFSTGPRTEQGKAISRMNALKSGIDARNEAAGGENPSALAALAAEYDREFQPLGVVERVVVDILVRDDWFLRRYRFLAADLINHAAGVAYETKRGADFGAGFATNTESFQRLHRHIIETERSFFTHLAELERRQTVRRQHQADNDPPATDSSQTENREIGFVSQSPADPAAPASPAAVAPPQTPNPGFGFVPNTTFRPANNRPPLLSICARPSKRRAHGIASCADPGLPYELVNGSKGLVERTPRVSSQKVAPSDMMKASPSFRA